MLMKMLVKRCNIVHEYKLRRKQLSTVTQNTSQYYVNVRPKFIILSNYILCTVITCEITT